MNHSKQTLSHRSNCISHNGLNKYFLSIQEQSIGRDEKKHFEIKHHFVFNASDMLKVIFYMQIYTDRVHRLTESKDKFEPLPITEQSR